MCLLFDMVAKNTIESHFLYSNTLNLIIYDIYANETNCIEYDILNSILALLGKICE